MYEADCGQLLFPPIRRCPQTPLVRCWSARRRRTPPTRSAGNLQQKIVVYSFENNIGRDILISASDVCIVNRLDWGEGQILLRTKMAVCVWTVHFNTGKGRDYVLL